MRSPSRLQIIHGCLFLFAAALVVKSGREQLWRGRHWAEVADRQHFDTAGAPAPRGLIMDATGAPLVESREMVSLAVAPTEVAARDRGVLARGLVQAGVPRPLVARATDARRRWVPLPGRFLPSRVAELLRVRGVHHQPVVDRVLLASPATRRIVGRVGDDGRPVDGIELALDSLLQGSRGNAAVPVDARGHAFDSPSAHGDAPRPGDTVVLTINAALQDICERALGDAVAQSGAEGGDIVVMDPHDGSVLAMVSQRADPRSTASTVLSEPYEPGSTLKPVIVARLLELGRAHPEDVVDTHGGTWVYDGRTITDEHRAARMTLREVIMNSSNIGIVQFAQRLAPREEYEALRDAGFGMPTGLPYPAEAAGTLHEPARWSHTSPASMAMGYEIAVTPMQLAAAYASIANGGELLEPALVKEVRAADGTVRFRHERRVVRRIMTPATARILLGMLVETVAHGTAVDADLHTFELAGKTGTARRVSRGRGYAAGEYTASFVGLFPSESPQFVILVKLDDPRGGSYFGGKVAAPVSKVVLDAALAARDAALDRDALADRVRPVHADSQHPHAPAPALPSIAAAPASPAPPAESIAMVPFEAAVGPAAPAPSRGATSRPLAPVIVPDVHGLPLRAAVRALHHAGLRVAVAAGHDGETAPVAGTPVRPGTLVRLFHAQ